MADEENLLILKISDLDYKSYISTIEFITNFLKKNDDIFQTFYYTHIDKGKKYKNLDLDSLEKFMTKLNIIPTLPKKRKRINKNPDRIKQKTYFTENFKYTDKFKELCEKIDFPIEKEKYTVPNVSAIIYKYIKRNDPDKSANEYTVDQDLIDLFPNITKDYPLNYYFADTKKEFKKMMHFIIREYLLWISPNTIETPPLQPMKPSKSKPSKPTTKTKDITNEKFENEKKNDIKGIHQDERKPQKVVKK